MIIKCKMCGGDVEFEAGATYGTCQYCGITSTIPKADDESKLNRYNRANHFRRQGEFDKAVAAYEKILEQDDTDAEAHWGAVISRFGIEYVEDPATGQRIPTCHRLQLTSILADEDYKAAVENAPDARSRALYEEEAARIAEIQRGILAISQNEKPYDVFICYKETDENGRRTHDSQWAQDVYYGLTEQGYKVFFSRITLEDKLGQEYEPYIFAALQSARVMVVIGSKPEYFNTVWVKNEWNRFLALMARDRGRLLIPCYRGMDPYDLPDELSSLQSQDMSKIGFMQDLIRGVKKVLDADRAQERPATAPRTMPAEGIAAPGVGSLMDRARLFLEDGDFDSAREYLDRVLDIDPKYAPAYAAKACVAFRLRSEEDLAETAFRYDDNPDWQKALRFADPGQKAVYEGWAAKVEERVARQIRDYAYDCAVEMAVLPGADRGKLDAELAAYRTACTRSAGKRADGSRRPDSRLKEDVFLRAVKANEPGDMPEANLKSAAAMFAAIGDDEAAERAAQCRALAEQARQKAIYLQAAEMYGKEQGNPAGLDEAARLFLSVPDYRDAKRSARICADAAESIRSGLYDDAVKAMNDAGGVSGKWKAARQLLAVTELNGYRDVIELRAQAAQRYEECMAAEQEARRQAEERQRREAEAAAAKKRNTILAVLAVVLVAAAALIVTQVIVPGNNYRNALALRKEGRYEEAVEAFTALGSYSDASTQVKETKYLQAKALQQAGRYDEAIAAFTALGSYSDAAMQITETKYLHAKALTEKGDYAGAVTVFNTIRGYKDVDSLLANDDNLAAAAAAREAKLAPYKTVGSYVSFGRYEQDNNTANGQEPIEWIVLDYDAANNRALLVSRYGLDAKPYNTSYTGVTWEYCSLRSWLNGDFLRTAFTAEEQGAILTTTVDNSKGQGYSGWSTGGGNNTQDKVFLLSYAEANKYFGVEHYNTSGATSNTRSRVRPTAYAIAQGAWTSTSYQTAEGEAAGWWWLRSPGHYQGTAAYVNHGGALSSYYVSSDDGSVRPAFWLNLDSGIF